MSVQANNDGACAVYDECTISDSETTGPTGLEPTRFTFCSPIVWQTAVHNPGLVKAPLIPNGGHRAEWRPLAPAVVSLGSSGLTSKSPSTRWAG